MSDQRDLDLDKVLEAGTKKTSLQDLERKGFKQVKVLDENALRDLIRTAVDRVVSSQTAEEKTRILAESRKELDRLMKEHKADKGRAQLLEADKNELVEQVEALQRELELKSELEEEELHRKYQEGTASMQKQVEEIQKRLAQSQDDLETASGLLDEEKKKSARGQQIDARLRELQKAHESALTELQELRDKAVREEDARQRASRELEESRRRAAELEKFVAAEQTRFRGAEQSRTDLVQQVLALQSGGDTSKREAEQLRRNAARLQQELESARKDVDRAEAAARSTAQESAALQSRLAELEARLASGHDTIRRTAGESARLDAESVRLRTEVDQLKKELAEERGERAASEERASKILEEADALNERLAELEARHASGQETVRRAGGEAEQLKKALADERQARAAAEERAARAPGEIEEAVRRAEAARSDFDKRTAEADRLQVENAALRQDAERLAVDVARFREEVAQERGKVDAASESRQSEFRALADELEAAKLGLDKRTGETDRLQVEQAALRQEADRLREELSSERGRLESVASLRQDEIRTAIEGLGAARLDLEKRGGEVDRLQVENAALRGEADRLRDEVSRERSRVDTVEDAKRDELRRLIEELGATREAADAARNETQFMRAQLAEQQKENEAVKGKTVIVTAELAEIEERQHQEKLEIDEAREESERLRGELQGLQEVLAREQEDARSARSEAATVAVRIQELLDQAAAMDEKSTGLDADNARLREQLRSADLGLASGADLKDRLEKLAALIVLAESNSAAAKDSAVRSRDAAALLQRTLAESRRPAGSKRSEAVRGGTAFDGLALFRAFLRKIALKERFQKHVPVTERPGEEHPSDLLVRVVEALVSGRKRDGRKEKGPRLEILGPAKGPDVADLRLFLGRLGPNAVHRIGRVHDALRLHLLPLPPKPDRIEFDVDSVEAKGGKGGARKSFAPLVCFEPSGREFWHGQFRPSRDGAPKGYVPFLKECVNKVPPQFGRTRLRFHLPGAAFNEDTVRFMNRTGCSYVMPAPDLKEFRERAKKGAWRELSNGWESSEFLQRIHPIRKTEGRFVVLRRRLSRKDVPGPAPLFKDPKHAYWVYAVDKRLSPWRAYESYASREASLGDAKGLLADFAESRLLGRRRRSHAALFQLHLLASDVVQWFKKKGLPVAERERSLESLRGELLMLPPVDDRAPAVGLPVLPRKDKRRRAFDGMTRAIRRIRPVRAWRFRS